MSDTLDDLIGRLSAMGPEERREIEEVADEATKWMKWIPNPGPQTDAYYSLADILLYGGSGGSGKTDLGLGLAFNEHERSLIMRRKYTNLSGLTERAIEINGSKNGFNGSPPPLLRTDRGKYIQFGANQHLGDEQAWQGVPFDLKCVAKGTRVVMHDGSLRPIETLRVGDRVHTLEGPRRVIRLIPPRVDDALRVGVHDADGKRMYYQDQSLTHEVLTPMGWVRHGKFVSSFPSLISVAKQNHSDRKCSESRARISVIPSLYRAVSVRCFLQTLGCARSVLGSLGRGVANVFLGQPLREPAASASCVSLQGAPLLPLWCVPLVRWLQHLPLANCMSHPCTFSSRDYGADFWSRLPDWMGRYSSGNRQCDGRARQRDGSCYGEEGDRVYLLQPFGVEQPNPICSEDDDLGKTPRHSFRIDTYAHPYTKEIRQVGKAETFSSASCQMLPVGKVTLYDIEVEEVNHYITEGGFINKNCFDEAVQFLEEQIRFHLGWLRSTSPGQRTRAILGTNPPVTSDGDWIIGMFRPWLDITHHNPAKPGDLRWYITSDEGEDVEIPESELGTDENGRRVVQRDGKNFVGMSRSFIPGKLADNPYLIKTNYQATLDSLPEPIRSAVRDGNFMAARADADFQVIPTQWIIEAQSRWKPDGWKAWNMTAMSFDPAGGGNDAAELMYRHGPWFGECITDQGENTADGSEAAATIIKHRRHNAPVIIDVGGGYGGQVTMRMDDNQIPHTGFNGASATGQKTADRQLGFHNLRAEALWRLREALDPDQEGGSEVALPPNAELRSDLSAPTYKVGTNGILIESKQDIRKRLGRSTGKGDACMMCWASGQEVVKRGIRNRSSAGGNSRPAYATVGHANKKSKRRR